MNRPTLIFYIALTTAIVSLSLGLMLNDSGFGVLIPFVIGVIWFFSLRRKWRWGPSLSIAILLLIGGVNHGLEEAWIAVCVIASLVAWDLSFFILDTQHEKSTDLKEFIEREHLKRLFIVVLLSLFLFGISMGVSLNLSFGWVLLLGFLLILGLSRFIAALQQAEK